MTCKTIKIGLIGFGAVGKLLYRTLLEDNYNAENIYIFDDNVVGITDSRCYRFNDFKSSEFLDFWFIPTLGYLSGKLRLTILNYLIENKYNIFSYHHPSAFVSSGSKIGRGVLIYSMVNIDTGVIIGDGVIIANSTVIAHDSEIGNGVYFGANVCVCGEVKIGELCFIGSSATISNGLSIGKYSTIGMSSCITKDILDNSFAIGNPVQIKKNINVY
ncbi:MAG: sugar O-acyltransferase (sialic acid O-acetyltransferase NeuD family) [Mariniflexile sp.]|jgi:sugar O-acyltransferase (sialic acid O-acetyltransferase NeuD family)